MKRTCIVILCCLLTIACQNAENLYSRLPARFTWDNVLQVPELRTACESQGEYCLIYRPDTQHFMFQGTKTSTNFPIVELDRYKGCVMGLAGFFVGKPFIPDDNPIVCYDAACPNCYNDYSVARRMELKDGYMARCAKCERIYNLDDHGYVYKGPEGKRLIRYHVRYVPYVLSISN